MLDAYRHLAPLYDLIIPDPPGMLEFYSRFAGEPDAGEELLEVGAGTGRLSVLLASAGHRLVATDISAAMLEILELKLERAPEAVRGRVELACADQRELALGRRFALVLNTGGTLQHCLTPDDYRRSLVSMRAHLGRAGRLALDIAALSSADRRRSFRRDYGVCSGVALTPRWTEIHSWDEVSHDHARGVTRTDSYFEMRGPSGKQTDSFHYVFVQTFPGADELKAIVEDAGFVDVEIDGGFAGEAVSETSEQLVLRARAG